VHSKVWAAMTGYGVWCQLMKAYGVAGARRLLYQHMRLLADY
jgi:hypothetical protein